MNWSETIFRGCERAASAGAWGEPVNLVSALAYVIASGAAYFMLQRQPRFRRDADHYFLIALLLLIGFGAALFHIFAQRWSELALLVPLGIFTLVYTAFALNRFLGWPPGVTFLATVMLSAISLAILAGGIRSERALDTDALALALLPFLCGIGAVGWQLKRWGQRSAGSIFLAAGLLAVSLVFYALDGLFCEYLFFMGHKLGFHFVWHVLSAGSFYILLRAAIAHGDPAPRLEILPPQRKSK